MIRYFGVVGAALMALPSVAHADDPKPKVKGPPKICRAYDNSASRIATRVCKTQAQWDEEARVNDITNGDFEVRGDRVATGRVVNTGSPLGDRPK